MIFIYLSCLEILETKFCYLSCFEMFESNSVEALCPTTIKALSQSQLP